MALGQAERSVPHSPTSFSASEGPSPWICVRSTPSTACRAARASKAGAFGRFVVDASGGNGSTGLAAASFNRFSTASILLIAVRDLGLVGVVKLQRLVQGEDVLVAPVAGQRALIVSAEAWQRRSRWAASTPGSRSPATMARMMRMPVAPVMSVTT